MSEDRAGAERRQCERISCDTLKLSVKRSALDGYEYVCLYDISTGGVKFICDKEYALESKIYLCVEDTLHKDSVCVKGKVWRVENLDNTKCVVIYFTTYTDDSGGCLFTMLNRRISSDSKAGCPF